LRKPKDKGLEVREDASIEPEVDTSPSFFPLAALLCHIIFLFGLCNVSPAPVAALLAPSIIVGAGVAARSGMPRWQLSPGAALQGLFVVQMVAIMTWWVHAAYAAPSTDVCPSQVMRV
jgi:hypothetical protein